MAKKKKSNDEITLHLDGYRWYALSVTVKTASELLNKWAKGKGYRPEKDALYFVRMLSSEDTLSITYGIEWNAIRFLNGEYLTRDYMKNEQITRS